MKDLYFLSDVHLGLGSKETERRKRALLTDLLSEARDKAEHVFIVGDLFDFWFEYRHVVPRGHHAVLTALEQLSSAGVGVTYLAGNHDFGIGPSLAADLGISIVKDDLLYDADGRRFYLYHGDGLAVNDTGYRIIKAILRNRACQWMFRWLHPDIGFALARLSSHSSRKYTANKSVDKVDGMLREAQRRIDEGASYVVMGHRHRATLQRLGAGVYVNLGDWLTSFSYAVFREGRMHLVTRKRGIEESVSSE